MTVTAENLVRKYKYDSYENKKVEGRKMALRYVGNLLESQMTNEEFDQVVRHVTSAGDDIPATRKAFNEGYLEMLETLMEI